MKLIELEKDMQVRLLSPGQRFSLLAGSGETVNAPRVQFKLNLLCKAPQSISLPIKRKGQNGRSRVRISSPSLSILRGVERRSSSVVEPNRINLSPTLNAVAEYELKKKQSRKGIGIQPKLMLKNTAPVDGYSVGA